MMAETKPTQVNVDNAENVNVPSVSLFAHPAVIYLVAFVTVGVLLGFGWVTWSVLTAPSEGVMIPGPSGPRRVVNGIDPATKGAVIQTWNNLAVAAAAVWTTSNVVNRLKGSSQ
jgi:hypothetical protein